MLRRHTDTVVARSASATSRALVLASVLVLIGLGMAVPMRSWLSQQAEIASLRTQVEAARAEVAGLEVQRERWKDPAYIAAQARERLMFVFPGEIGYVAIGTNVPEEQSAVMGDVTDQSWYERLWRGLQEADAPATIDQDAEQPSDSQDQP